MKKKTGFLIFMALIMVAALALSLYFSEAVGVLFPKGMIAFKQRKLFIIAGGLMLIVVIPVFLMTFFIAWKYRDGNAKANYSPEWDNSHVAELIWWGVPLAIIAVLGAVAWKASHELDPYRPIDTGVKPMQVQVIALQWKWLFLYPEEQIATVNYLQIPEKTPIHFELTGDAPMNSFWIPDLGGQIFAMSGMKTSLHLIADSVGEFRGSSANISGDGFAGMSFSVHASSREEFDAWAAKTKQSPLHLSREAYEVLASPSKNLPPAFYVLDDLDLYEQVVSKYTAPAN